MENQRRKLRKLVRMVVGSALVLLVFTISTQVLAQDGPRSWAQFFGGFGGITGDGGSQAVLHLGGGGEALLAGGLGVTGEIGYLSNYQDFSGGIGVFSVGGMYAFSRDHKTVPFVNGGYTLFFRSGSEHGFFFGGGVNHWIGENWGIRVEGRDQVLACDTGIHILEARFAILLK